MPMLSKEIIECIFACVTPLLTEDREDRVSHAAQWENVTSELNRLGVACELITIDPAYSDTRSFCEHYGYPLDNVGNTIIVGSRREPKVYAACLVTARKRLDVNHTVRDLLGVRRLSFATGEETEAINGMALGGETIVCLPPELPIYIDSSILFLDYLIIGGGDRSHKIRLAPSDIERIPQVKTVEGLAEARPSPAMGAGEGGGLVD